MIDCNIMVDVVNHLQKTEKFKNAEQEYQNLKTKSKKFDMSKASVVGGVLGFDLICLGSLLDNSAKGELFVAGGAVAIGSFYLVKKFREKLYGSKETINSMIRDCYLQEKAVKEKMAQGANELTARIETKTEFKNMSYRTKTKLNSLYQKDIDEYEDFYNIPFNYKKFIVSETEDSDELKFDNNQNVLTSSLIQETVNYTQDDFIQTEDFSLNEPTM